jgi:urease accessory protein
MNPSSLLSLLQLVSPTLPVGAYSYSEGLEYLIEKDIITDQKALENWLSQELKTGSIRLESAVLLRAYQASITQKIESLNQWNNWLSATRETLELRQQSWQMGKSLEKLLLDLIPDSHLLFTQLDQPCNYAIAVGIGATYWQIEPSTILLAYLSSWANNLISAGVRLVPLGQTMGQRITLNLQPTLIQISQDILELTDENLYSCSWGLGLASMNHEVQYTRLFRS